VPVGDDPVHPLDAEGLRTRVHKEIDGFLARQVMTLEDVSLDCAPLQDAIGELMRGGKRLRAAFCYWGWRGAGGPDSPSIVSAATAMEFFQSAALIHDDLMDNSDTRRGIPSTHRRFAALHRSRSWQGDADRFGLAGAVLAGDLCLVWSEEIFAGCGVAPAQLSHGQRLFDRMRAQLMGGQYLDMLEQAVPPRGSGHAVERARQVIRYKSAKYSVEYPLLIGAALAGADDRLLETYSAFGLPLGEAFQLRDDVLGVFGDPRRTGKPAGDDLREGKRTVLVAKALEAASPAQAEIVHRLLGDPDLEAQGVADLRQVLVETGALDAVERLIDELVGRTRSALAEAWLHDPARRVLDELVEAATARSA